MTSEHRGLEFFRAGDKILPIQGILGIDVSKLVKHEVSVSHREGYFLLTGADAIDLVMIVKPSALEGRRLRWVRGAWAGHNIVGHVGMQILAWLKIPTWGVWLHEATTPRPQNDIHKSQAAWDRSKRYVDNLGVWGYRPDLGRWARISVDQIIEEATRGRR